MSWGEFKGMSGRKFLVPIQHVGKVPRYRQSIFLQSVLLSGDLHFAYALPEDDLDGRIYRCTTNNTFLDVEVKGGYTQLTVTRSKKIL